MKTTKSNSAKTVLIISIGFTVVFLLFESKWALNTAIIVGLLGIISNKICDVIDFLWMKLAKVLSFIVPNILLSIIFYLFLFPIAVLSRLFGNKTGLQLKKRPGSLWIERNTQVEKVSFEKMW
jgi:hypothetical protein